MAKIKVDILNRKIIPSLGKGPFIGITINEELFRSLKMLGYQINKHVPLAVPEPVEVIAEFEEIPEEVEVAVTEEVVEVEEPIVEEEPVVETEVEEEVFILTEEHQDFLKDAKKDDIRKFLTENGFEFKQEDTIAELLAYVGMTR